MFFAVVTLFPAMFEAVTSYGVTRRACERGLIEVQTFNPRDYAYDKFKTVDDKPYGGGPGMLMKVQPLKDAIAAARLAAPAGSKVVCMSPQGQALDHSLVSTFHQWGSLILVAGRYEGIDERVLETEVDLEVSIGDYVLSGGELPAMCVIDSVSRLVPNVLGDIRNAQEDSFAQGLLHFPQYTKPEVVDGLAVPEIVLSGHHARIAQWRLQQSLIRTYERRPDLLKLRGIDAHEYKILKDYLIAKGIDEYDKILDDILNR